jgi:TIR domain
VADMTDPPPVRILISYRREDSAGHAGRVFDALMDRFGREQVFMDIDAIEPGVDFSEVIAREVASCDVLLAVIGRRWLSITDAKGRRRLDNPEDFHRLEIQEALQRGIRVIPVLVQGAAMPTAEDLPEPMGRLAMRNALDLSDHRWRYDMGRLISALEAVARTQPASETTPAPSPGIPATPPPQPPGPTQTRGKPQWGLIGAASAVVAVAVILLMVLLGGNGEPEALAPASSPSAGATAPSTSPSPSASPSASVSPTPTPSPTPSPSVTAGTHEVLRAHVPSHLEASCTNSDDFLPEGAVAGIQCIGSGNTVWYYQFLSEREINAWYNQRLSAIGATRNQGSCQSDATSEYRFLIGAEEADGRAVCHTLSDGRWIEWTRRDLLIYSYANRPDGAKRKLYDFWGQAGPV